ncbi:MAG TPA: hypothetical protein VHW90_13610 [Stellaceae bacterium]|jgi:hypothetical protein|nr:hypothetical protein [Stellaceae bacterium]
MRNLLIIVAGFGLAAGLSACGAPEAPPVVYANSGWRTAYGAPLSLGEVAALRQSCVPKRTLGPMDTERPERDVTRDNPSYHPGGEGLASAPLNGIAAPDRPSEPGTRLSAGYGATPMEICLSDKGIIKTP